MRKSTWTWTTLIAAALLAAPPVALAGAGAKEQPAAGTTRTIQVGVTGEFSPAEIHVKRGEKVNLVFTRTTDRTCANSVHLKAFGIDRDLPLNKPVTVAFKTERPGKYRFACSMNHIAGNVVVD